MHSHAPPRATRRFGDHHRLFTRRRRPLTRFHALDAPSADTCPLRMTSWMTSPSTTRFNPDRPGNLTRSEPPAKKKLKKKGKRKCFDQVDPWPWPKSQNFQNGPVPLNFSSTFRFWDPFLHSKLRNCANVQFPKVDFCTNIDQKVKIFKKDLSYLIFRVDSIFGVYFFIWESEIAQIVWFYNCWP